MKRHPIYNLISIIEASSAIQETTVTHKAWRHLLQVQKDSSLNRALADLEQMIDDVETQVLKGAGDAHGVAMWKQPLAAALTPTGLTQQWIQHQRIFSPPNLSVLRSQARALVLEFGQVGFDSELLQESIDSLRNVEDLIANSDLPQDMKAGIIERLHQLISVIQRHKFGSPSLVEDQMKIMVTELAFYSNSDDGQALKKSNIPSKLWATLQIVANAMQVVQGAPSILPHVRAVMDYVTKD